MIGTINTAPRTYQIQTGTAKDPADPTEVFTPDPLVWVVTVAPVCRTDFPTLAFEIRVLTPPTAALSRVPKIPPIALRG